MPDNPRISIDHLYVSTFNGNEDMDTREYLQRIMEYVTATKDLSGESNHPCSPMMLLVINCSSVSTEVFSNDLKSLEDSFLWSALLLNNLYELALLIVRQSQLLKNSLSWGSFLSTEDQLQSLQICFLEREKLSETADVSLSSPKQDKNFESLFKNFCQAICYENMDPSSLHHQTMQEYKKFLDKCNALDTAVLLDSLRATGKACNWKDGGDKEIIRIIPVVILEKGHCSIVELRILTILGTLVAKTNLLQLNANKQELRADELEFENSFLNTFHCDPDSVDKVTRNDGQNRLSPCSTAKLQLKRTIFAYLQLLVNAKDEIALARAINVPDRGVGRQALTALRKTSQRKNMSMFQTAVSYTLHVKLGGKSYAPEKDDPLLDCLEGISDFVSLMHELQDIMEEHPDASTAFAKVLRRLRKTFLRADKRPFDGKTIGAAFDEISFMFKSDIRALDFFIFPKSAVSNLKTSFSLQWMLDKAAASRINPSLSLQDDILATVLKTPESSASLLRIPSLATAFRTPEEVDISETPKRKKRSADCTTPARLSPVPSESEKETENGQVLPFRQTGGASESVEDEVLQSTRHDVEAEKENAWTSEMEKMSEMVSEKDRNSECAQLSVPLKGPTEVNPARKAKLNEIHLTKTKGKSHKHTKNDRVRPAKARKREMPLLPGQKRLTLFFKQAS